MLFILVVEHWTCSTPPHKSASVSPHALCGTCPSKYPVGGVLRTWSRPYGEKNISQISANRLVPGGNLRTTKINVPPQLMLPKMKIWNKRYRLNIKAR